MCGISGYLDLDRGVDIGILRRMMMSSVTGGRMTRDML